MSEIGVLVKVPAELHSAFKRASGQHQRSMQKVMVALLEGWIESGAPDPLSYGSGQHKAGKQSSTEDLGARQALLQVATELKELKQRVAQLEQDEPTKSKQSLNFEAFFEALGEAAGSENTRDASKQKLNWAAFGEAVQRAAEEPAQQQTQEA